MLAGRQRDSCQEDRKLEAARKPRQIVASSPREERKASLGQPESRMKWNTSGWPTQEMPIRTHFFSNSFQFAITVMGSDVASLSTELMMNFWPSGIAAHR
jgi:hypothetical protein